MTMNSWQRGRQEILEGVANIYDKIQADAQTGKVPLGIIELALIILSRTSP